MQPLPWSRQGRSPRGQRGEGMCPRSLRGLSQSTGKDPGVSWSRACFNHCATLPLEGARVPEWVQAGPEDAGWPGITSGILPRDEGFAASLIWTVGDYLPPQAVPEITDWHSIALGVTPAWTCGSWEPGLAPHWARLLASWSQDTKRPSWAQPPLGSGREETGTLATATGRESKPSIGMDARINRKTEGLYGDRERER